MSGRLVFFVNYASGTESFNLFSTSLSFGSSKRISESSDEQSLFSWNCFFTIEGDLQTLLAKLILPPVLFS
jgi:hypothetical protein